VHGKPDPRLRTAVSSAERAESLRFIGAYVIIIAAHRAFLSGSEGPRHRGIV
jgi:hypothetical protein